MEIKIKSFTDLKVWQKGHQLVLEIYQTTKSFPSEETFGLVIQLRRAAVSFVSNIAEGFSRSSFKEKSQFYSIALGSLTEMQSQILIAKDLGYITQSKLTQFEIYFLELNKMTNGLIKRSRISIRVLDS